MKRFLAALAGLALFLSASSVAVAADVQLVPTIVAPHAAEPASPAVAAPAAPELPLLAPDAFVEKGFLEKLADPTFIVQLGVFFGLLLGFMRGLADILLWVSAKTENKADDKAAAAISDFAWWLGALVAKMGWSTPKPIVADKVDQAVAKTASNG